jgi:predicted NAD/FAD-binding protein
MRKKLAIVGSGIAAMGCAYYLKDDYDITIFEKHDYVGGHTHTHHLKEDGRDFTVDTGFIVFNLKTYPNLVKMFAELGVQSQKCDMSFAVWNLGSDLQYSSRGVYRLFAQPKNLLSLRHWKLIFEILKFCRLALADADAVAGSGRTIREYCKSKGLSDYFVENYLAPMSSAVWSTGIEDVYDFPIELLIPFFRNHGFLNPERPVQWYSVCGGSDDYAKKILASGQFELRLNEPVEETVENDGGVRLKTAKGEYDFDYAVLASHSDESLKIAKGLSAAKRELLGKFGYNANKAVLHTDATVMPPLPNAWGAWTHVIKKGPDDRMASSTAYWMNPLQNLGTKADYFVSINPLQPIDPKKVIREIAYTHPNFTVENFALQKRLQELNDDTRLFFAGAYFKYGFHEDGLASGLAVVQRLKKLAQHP